MENTRNKTEVLFVDTGELLGGGQFSLLDLVTHLKETHIVPHLLLSSDGEFAARARDAGLNPTIAPMAPLKKLNSKSKRGAVQAIIDVIRKNRIKLIHINTGVTRETFYTLRAARMERIRTVWHVRVVEKSSVGDMLLGRAASRVVAISDAVAWRFRRRFLRSKVRIVHNGINVSRFDPEHSGDGFRREFGVPDDAFVVGVMGQIIPWKGHKIFLDAAELIRKQMPHAFFLVVGGPGVGQESYLEELKLLTEKKGLSESVIFTGFRDDIENALSAMDTFVLPSHAEPFGRVLVEAMAMKKPVVATDAGGVPEIVENGETGVLVPTGDPCAAANAIIAFANDGEKMRLMGEAARKRVEEHFSIAAHVEGILKVYDELL